MSPSFARKTRWKLKSRSLRDRYIYLAVAFSVVLAAVAFAGWRYVKHTTSDQIQIIEQRLDTSDAVADVAHQIRTLEVNLQRFVILPSQESRQAVERAFGLYESSIQRLGKTSWITRDDSLRQVFQQLNDDGERLLAEIDRLLLVRSDVEKWFPAMVLMRKSMQPMNEEFMSALDLAIYESSETLDSDRQRQSYQLLLELRQAWQQLILEFRLYVANRFGVFSNDPGSAMLARVTNIQTHKEHVATLLEHLVQRHKRGLLDLQASESLGLMRRAHQSWEQAFSDVIEMVESNEWRVDLSLLQKNVHPLFEQIVQQLSKLQLEVDVSSAKDMASVTTLAKRLSNTVIFLAVGGIFVILAGFLVFHRTVLTPIAQIARALKAEARGYSVANIPSSRADEIRNLTEAFSEMRQQVRQREQHLDHMAHHDALTGLPNRVLFRDRLQRALDRAQREDHIAGLMFLDLDRFKQINDSLGHDVGDQLLTSVADRLQRCIRKTDTVARLGGDEFAIVVEGLTDVDQVSVLAQKTCEIFHEPFYVRSHELHVTTSIGIALYPYDDTEADTLVKNADIAMYYAKDQGKNNFKFYSSEMTTRVDELLVMEAQLRRAYERAEFDVHYQPVVDVVSGNMVSVEALLRWRHPEEGFISAGQYIPILDETGLIVPITEWVLAQACTQVQRCKAKDGSCPSVSVNVSGQLLKSRVIVDQVERALTQSGVDPQYLTVEITEDTLTKDLVATEAVLRKLKDLGVQIALDDFGTRQSSLSHLRRNPIDIVKIDRDFVRDIPADRNDSQLVAAIIAMTHKLGIKVVAEGVETPEQLAFLRRHKCDAVQGYLFSPPVSAQELPLVFDTSTSVTLSCI